MKKLVFLMFLVSSVVTRADVLIERIDDNNTCAYWIAVQEDVYIGWMRCDLAYTIDFGSFFDDYVVDAEDFVER